MKGREHGRESELDGGRDSERAREGNGGRRENVVGEGRLQEEGVRYGDYCAETVVMESEREAGKERRKSRDTTKGGRVTEGESDGERREKMSERGRIGAIER